MNTVFEEVPEEVTVIAEPTVKLPFKFELPNTPRFVENKSPETVDIPTPVVIPVNLESPSTSNRSVGVVTPIPTFE